MEKNTLAVERNCYTINGTLCIEQMFPFQSNTPAKIIQQSLREYLFLLSSKI